MSIVTKTETENLASTLLERCGVDASLCIQCKKCTSGCPVAESMDLKPSQFVRAIQMGRSERAFSCNTPWVCAHCETCATRCPQAIDIPLLMDTVRKMARERGLKPRLPDVETFYDTAVDWIDRLGRLYELGVMIEYNLRTKQPMRNMGLGMKMMRNRKIGLLPTAAGRGAPAPTVDKTLEAESKRMAYYPGCSLHSSSSEYDSSTKAVAAALNVELAEPKGWVCCGTGAVHIKSHEKATVLPMKSLALVAAAGDTRVALPCASCYNRFRTAVQDVEHDTALREKVRQETGYEYDGRIEVLNLIDAFTEVVGLGEIERRVVKPLKDLKVVCYYGCLLSRPPDVTGEVRYEYPMSMDRLVKRLGAEVLDWSYKTECCGATLMLTQTDLALDMTERVLRNAAEVGADVVAVACPICHTNLDTRQYQIEKRSGQKYHLPVLYFTQLMGLAFGLRSKELELGKHFVDPRPLLGSKGL